MSTTPAPVLNQLKLYAFDVHLHLPQLWDASSVRPDFAFLVNRIAHTQAYRRENSPASPEVSVAPLGRELHENHFWRHYSLLLPAPPGKLPPLPWDRHLPFVFSLPTGDRGSLEYKTSLSELDAEVGAEILVWPYGWSSNLTISLTGPVAREQIQEIADEVRSGTPFRFGGKSMPLWAIFDALSRRLMTAVYQQKIQDALPVKRRLVMTLLWERDAGRAAGKNGWDSAWASNVFPLSSESVPVEDRIHTRLKSPDFAVTYFQCGSLLSLSARLNQSLSALACAASNMRYFLVVAHTLLYLQKFGKQSVGASPQLDDLIQSARSILLALPEGYRNPLCRQFLTHHRLAKSLGLAPAEEGGPAATPASIPSESAGPPDGTPGE